MPGKSVFEMSFADVYPALIRKAERNRPVRELDDEAAPGGFDYTFESRPFFLKSKSPAGWRSFCFWRTGWDSNPRASCETT